MGPGPGPARTARQSQPGPRPPRWRLRRGYGAWPTVLSFGRACRWGRAYRLSSGRRYGYQRPLNTAGSRQQTCGGDRQGVSRGIMSNKMWGGRFSERPDEIMEEINVSIDVDRHLFAQDIAASKAHAAMLAAQGIITASDAKNIGRGLDTILSEIGKGGFEFKR